jgi:DNA repair exonuclease SbcCD ATPase subunit
LTYSKLSKIDVCLEGFGGYRDAVELSLSCPGLYGLFGENNTRDGADSNGAGKTTLEDGISWVLTGEVSRKLESVESVINYDCSVASGWISLVFDEGVVTIDRVRKRGESQKLQMAIDGVSLPEHRVADLQAKINELLGITNFRDFINFYYLTGTAVDTLTSSDTDPSDRHAVLSRMLHLEIFDRCKKEAKSRAGSIIASVAEKEGRLASVTAEKDRLVAENAGSEVVRISKEQEEIGKSKVGCEVNLAKLEENHKLVNLYLGLRESVDASSAPIHAADDPPLPTESELTLACNKANDAVIVAQAEMDESATRLNVEGGSKREALDALSGQMKDAEEKSNTAKISLRTAEAQLARGLCCPECSAYLMIRDGILHSFDQKQAESAVGYWRSKCDEMWEEVLSFRSDRDQAQSELDDFRVHATTYLSDVKLKVDRLYAVRDVAWVDLNDLPAKLKRRADVEKERQEANRKRDELKLRFVNLKSEMERKFNVDPNDWDCDYVLRLQAAIVEEKRRGREIDQSLASNRERLAVCNRVLSDLERQLQKEQEMKAEIRIAKGPLEHLVAAQDAFPKMRDAVMERFLPVFEAETNRLLAELGMVEQVQFSLTGTTKSGAVIQRFSIKVWDGRHWRESGTYSQGEWGRVAFSIAVAMRSVVLGEVAMNILMLDEAERSFDLTGLKYLLNVPQLRNSLTLVVSHHGRDVVGSLVDKAVIVTKSTDGVVVEVDG